MMRGTMARPTRAFVQLDSVRSPRTAVLLYHRVADLRTDPLLLAVSVKRFREQMAMLRHHFRVLRLDEMFEEADAGADAPPRIVVTFDDGYADNLHHAGPLLAAERVPATVFVAADYVKQEREFWWDELEGLLLHGDPLPSRLALCIHGKLREWALDDAPFDAKDLQRHLGWNVRCESSPSSRHRVYRELFDALRPLEDPERESILSEVAAWSGRPRGVRSTHRPLSRQELVRLAELEGIEIGGHTMTHPLLSAHSVESQAAEIAGCRQELESILERPVNAFAYPFGTRRDYTLQTVDIVREAGFRCAVSNFSAGADDETDRFQIPRVLVRDWDPDTLLRRIRDVLSPA